MNNEIIRDLEQKFPEYHWWAEDQKIIGFPKNYKIVRPTPPRPKAPQVKEKIRYKER